MDERKVASIFKALGDENRIRILKLLRGGEKCACKQLLTANLPQIVNVRKGDSMNKLAFVDKKVCVACGVCMKACPKSAISIYRGCYALVDESKCVGCGLCAKACPAGCITTKERSGVK